MVPFYYAEYTLTDEQQKVQVKVILYREKVGGLGSDVGK